jgi:S1-C subfamily serine protease
VIQDLKLLEDVERYINGQMSPDECVQFEGLRKSNPEIDQCVVEHTFFLHQMNRFDEMKKFKSGLNEIHIDLAEKGAIKSTRLRGKAKLVYLMNRYKRVAAIAASIAGITALTFSALVWSISPTTPRKEIAQLNRKFNELNQKNLIQDKQINEVKDQIGTSPTVTYKTGGTSFLIDPKGLLVTNAHVIANAKYIAVQNSEGKDLKVKVVFVDVDRDLAILKIDDTAFKVPNSIPYSIKRNSADIAEQVFTLGFPRNDIVYGEGYLSAKTGFNGDTMTCQIAIAANPGNSGGPVLNRNGEVIGILSTKQTSAEGVVFATQSKYIYTALNDLQKDTTFKKVKIPTTSSIRNLDRMQQVKKIADYVYMVKVN